MSTPSFSRRKFIKAAGMMTAMTALGEFPADLFAAVDRMKMVRFPEKSDLILLTSRPACKTCMFLLDCEAAKAAGGAR